MECIFEKGDIKNVPEKLAITAVEIERFLIKPMNAINKSQKFKGKWKAPGPWE